MGVMTDALTLGGNGTIYIVKWWVDASYVMHPNLKSQDGGTMSLGQGCIMSSSKKQKINTTSSCEAELVGVYYMMPQIIWTQYFLQCQVFNVKTLILYQDNKIEILMEENRMASSTKRTKNINVQ